MKKFQNIIKKYTSIYGVILILLIWEIISFLNIVPKIMLPSPFEVFAAFSVDFKNIILNMGVTLIEVFFGVIASILIGILIAILMDRFKTFNKSFYPILVLSQTIPTIAIAPIIVLWFGFGIFPKVFLIFLTCFFPITINVLSGFQNVDKDILRFMDSMGFSYLKTLFLVKFPLSLKSFFSGLKISASYAIMSAVVAEWLGGEFGIGVYMTRAKKGYAFDKMFASIIFTSLLSILVVYIIKILEKRCIYWEDL